VQRLRRLRWLAVAMPVGVLAAVGIGGSASATPQSAHAKAGTATITAEFVRKDRDLFWEGPDTVVAGETLKIKNNTNPRTIGPHTFSLVRKQDLPTTKNQVKACGKKLKGICGAIVNWHQVDLDTGQVGVNPVEVGKGGWDQEGSEKRKGDSVVLERGRGEKFSQKVTAKAGETLYFICAVHPFMQGKIEVVEGP
jgi:hypothetical protein